MKVDNKLISKFVIMILAVIGCFIQIQSTLSTFFGYETVTRTTYVVPQFMELMALSLCSPYPDLINYNVLNKTKNLISKTRNERHQEIQKLLTIKEIFDLTPDSRIVINGCVLRSNSTRTVTTLTTNAECMELFQTSKYYTQEYLCYLIKPKQFPIEYTTCTTTIDWPGVVYFIGIKYNVSRLMHYIKIVVHSSVLLPRESKRYSAYFELPENESSHFKVRYMRHILHYLGYPYDHFTCSNMPDEYDKCMEECTVAKCVKRFNKIPHDLNIAHPYEYRPISGQDVADPVVSREVDTIIRDCSNVCSVRPCETDYTLTDYVDRDYTYLEIALAAPVSPDISIRFAASLKTLDLFVYVMGAIGTWFGVAFINCDPIMLFLWFKNRCKFRGNNLQNESIPPWWQTNSSIDRSFYGRWTRSTRNN